MKTTKMKAGIAGVIFAGMAVLSFAGCSKDNSKGGASRIEKLMAVKPAAESDFEYEFSEDLTSVSITGFKGQVKKTLVIPATIQGLPVKKIEYLGGLLSGSNYGIVKAIVIPEGVEYVSGLSFIDSLTTVVLPSTLKYLEGLKECYNLTSIDLPEGLIAIGKSAFYGTGLTSVTLPKSLKFLGPEAFYDCNRLSEINIPEGAVYFTIGESRNNLYLPGWKCDMSEIFSGEKINGSIEIQKKLKGCNCPEPTQADRDEYFNIFK
ncbi:MAG: leucine-rich repeat domain-containing protein [Treponema sp.]|nr:leucine-rich repeat domain-containing protein [Treponema sp.]